MAKPRRGTRDAGGNAPQLLAYVKEDLRARTCGGAMQALVDGGAAYQAAAQWGSGAQVAQASRLIRAAMKQVRLRCERQSRASKRRR